MTPEHYKIHMAIEAARSSGDIERVTHIAFHLLSTIIAMDKSQGPENYRALNRVYDDNPWFCFARGTKEYCIGRCDGEPGGAEYRVACGSFVCWPEENWGDEIREEDQEP